MAGQRVVKGRSSVRCGWSNNNMATKTFSQISKQVNVMVDACYNIVKSKNLSIKICQDEQYDKMNNSAFSFSISIDANKKRKKKSPSQKKREKKRRKEWIKQKEDSKKSLTTDDSEASDKWESPPILPGNTDTQMVDDINSYSVSTSTTNEGEASDKSESSLIPGNADTEMVDNTTSESEYLTIHQMLENRCYARLRNRLDESLESY